MSWKIRLISIEVVVGILLRDESFLIAQRPLDKPYSGYWEFPGGKLESNELAEQALVRELYEELGINVITSQFLFNHQYTYPDKNVNMTVWLVKQFHLEPVGKEGQIIDWVSLEQMQNLPLLEGNWLILDKLKNLIGVKSLHDG